MKSNNTSKKINSSNLGLFGIDTLKTLKIFRSEFMKLEDMTPKQRVKIENWIQTIKECHSSGLSNEEWCNKNNVSIKQFYYYLAKIRKMAITEIPYKNAVAPRTMDIKTNDYNEIVEVKPCLSVTSSDSVATVYYGSSKIEIAANCPKWILELIMDRLC